MVSAAVSSFGPEPLREPLKRFLFEPETWVHPAWLASRLNPDALASVQTRSRSSADGPWPVRWLRQQVARECSVAELELSSLTGHWEGRLALLPADDALRLGMVVSLLPQAGQLHRSLDGHLRRALRQHVDESTVVALDAAPAAAMAARSTLTPGAWRQPDRVACAGLQAVVRQACAWPAAVVRRFEWRMDPQVWAVPASVAGLTTDSLEVACRALFPDHPWLWC